MDGNINNETVPSENEINGKINPGFIGCFLITFQRKKEKIVPTTIQQALSIENPTKKLTNVKIIIWKRDKLKSNFLLRLSRYGNHEH